MVIGINYQTAPLKLREKITLSKREKGELIKELISDEQVKEMMILATCNRTEVYLLLENEDAENFVWRWLLQRTGETVKNLRECTYKYKDLAAVRHLMTVACGLDSMILGEEQILGQVREAYQFGISAGSISTYFHHLLSEVLRVGKKVRTVTGISKHRPSISSIAVELVKEFFRDFASIEVLVLGGGEMGKLALESLYKVGVKKIHIINRDQMRGAELAEIYGGFAHLWEEKRRILTQVDVVISSTSAPHYVITCEDLQEFRCLDERSLVLIDIAVPRDVEPQVGEIPGVKVFNIDDLQQMTNQYFPENDLSFQKAVEIIREEVEIFSRWLKKRKVSPIIREFRKQAELIRQDELKKMSTQLDLLGEQGQILVTELTHRIVAKLLHEPTVQLKKLAEDGDSSLYLICQLYNLDLSGKDVEDYSCQNTTQ